MAVNKGDQPKTDTNAWMTTYTDLMTLLLTFFVLLLSISTIDEKNRRVALNSLVGAFGFKPGAHSIIGSPEGMNITLGSAPMKKEDISFEKLQNVVIKNTLEQDVDVVREGDRVVLSLGNRVLFEEGSAEIRESSASFLSELGAVLREDDPNLVELRGFAAHAEILFEPDPARSSLLLSTQRALAVFQFFAERSDIPADALVAHGFGEPATFNRGKGKQGRFNRQVQIILDFEQEIPYRLRKRTGDSVLDFKGFLFRFPGNMHE